MQETLTPPYLLVEGLFVIFILQAILTSWEVARMNFKTLIPDWMKRQELMGWKSAQTKSKVLVNSTNQNTPINIMMNSQNLEEVDDFKYLGSTLSIDGTSTKEIKIRIAVAMSSMSRLNTIWKSRDISFKTKLMLYRALAVSILFYR